MADVTIYTTMLCPYCHAAKKLLNDKNVAYNEIDVTFDPGERQRMAERAGKKSVPQIFIGDFHVGGSDELYALENKGALDPLLAA